MDKKSILVKQELKAIKKDSLRYNEYYNMQPAFGSLYKQSQENSKFKNLYNLIISEENIVLAYRNIKRNKGSKTAGTNRHTIKVIENQTIESYIKYIQNRFENYQPHSYGFRPNRSTENAIAYTYYYVL